MLSKIAPCLWFDTQAEEAARFYVSVFPNARVTAVSHYGDAGHERHGRTPGSVALVEFELEGRTFTALNGGPQFKFTEAVSFQIECADQAEVDYYWAALSAGGQERHCGWVQDRYGLCWQIVPAAMLKFLTSEDAPARDRAFAAMMDMDKLDIATLERAFAGD